MSGQARALTPGELAAILNPYAIQKGFKVAALSDNDPDGPCDVLHAVYERHEQVSENEWEPSVELVELRDTDDYDDFLLGVIAALAAELARAQAGAQAVAAEVESLRTWAIAERQRAWDAEQEAVLAGIIPGPLDWKERKGAALNLVVGKCSYALAQASAEGAGAGEVAG
ncbi:hypothetical protein [uncultured Deinococcus sp.]|uniref:hypothetical protein n=1 Tax=uncultured Deinococcus sp. TaxID=158789 RepID=UPI00374A4E5B